MPGIKELKNRIKSVKSTRKITRAMQMVSAAKMRKAQSAVLASRTYSTLAWDLIEKLSERIILDSPLLKTYKQAEKVGVIILATNRGLVGSLNTNLLKETLRLVGQDAEVISEVVVYGKKAKLLAQKTGKQIIADFEKPEKNVTSEEIYSLAKYITGLYASGEYKKIVIVYNHFVSTLVQKPTVKQILPFTTKLKKDEEFKEWEEEEAEDDDREEELNEEGQLVKKPKLGELAKQKLSEYLEAEESMGYIFEPTPELVLKHLLPRIIESQIFQTILESNASEHSARMVMMKNATEAAGDLISDYTLTYNQLRQNKITTELAEITAGKIALE